MQETPSESDEYQSDSRNSSTLPAEPIPATSFPMSTPYGRIPAQRPVRRRLIPAILFIATCVSTFLAGIAHWDPATILMKCWQFRSLMPIRGAVLSHWSDGLTYMACLLAILLTHEMGHFLATVRYRIPATLPYFLPLPISPVGTLGAVIGMDGLRANRREIFDIGLAGPLAGLVVAIPTMWIGIQQLDLEIASNSMLRLDLPLAARWIMSWVQPPGSAPDVKIGYDQLNPFFMAGWVGFLITGLNMMPVSQLDGGHLIYTLFGRRAHWIARGFIVFAIAYIFSSPNLYGMSLMVLLILFLGTDHPPTRDDSVPLGWVRTTVGFISLSIPILCFPPKVILM